MKADCWARVSGCVTGHVWRVQRGTGEPACSSDVEREAESRDCRGDPGPCGAQGEEQQTPGSNRENTAQVGNAGASPGGPEG